MPPPSLHLLGSCCARTGTGDIPVASSAAASPSAARPLLRREHMPRRQERPAGARVGVCCTRTPHPTRPSERLKKKEALSARAQIAAASSGPDAGARPNGVKPRAGDWGKCGFGSPGLGSCAVIIGRWARPGPRPFGTSQVDSTGVPQQLFGFIYLIKHIAPG